MEPSKEPTKLLSLPELSRELGIFYSMAFAAFKAGDLVPDYVTAAGRPLFSPSNLKTFLLSFRRRLTADEFLKAATRIKATDDTSRFQLVDITGTIDPDAHENQILKTTVGPGATIGSGGSP